MAFFFKTKFKNLKSSQYFDLFSKHSARSQHVGKTAAPSGSVEGHHAAVQATPRLLGQGPGEHGWDGVHQHRGPHPPQGHVSGPERSQNGTREEKRLVVNE